MKVPSFDRFLKKFLAPFDSILNVVDSEATDIEVWCGGYVRGFMKVTREFTKYACTIMCQKETEK